MTDHEKLLRDVLRVRFQSLVDAMTFACNPIQRVIEERAIKQFITDTKAIADKFPCLWDLVTEMESDLMSEVR